MRDSHATFRKPGLSSIVVVADERFPQRQARAGPAADEGFVRPAVAELTTPLATEESSAASDATRALRHGRDRQPT